MALKIGDNFSYQGQKPNFDRDSFDTLAVMKAFPETSIDEGHISYCKEDGKNYQYKATNSLDATTGKWREFKSGDSYPTGGTSGQVLTKTETGVTWQNVPTELPSGGTVGHVLKKTSNGVAWQNDNDTTYSKATQQADGLMSKEDKTKLDGLTGASLQILTQEEYDSTEPKLEDTVYFIKG